VCWCRASAVFSHGSRAHKHARYPIFVVFLMGPFWVKNRRRRREKNVRVVKRNFFFLNELLGCIKIKGETADQRHWGRRSTWIEHEKRKKEKKWLEFYFYWTLCHAGWAS
jgi:hypothetical protein